MSRFKCRASALKSLMTTPRSKCETLSDTARDVIKDQALFDAFGYRKNIKSKYIDKGNECEAQAIEAVSLKTFCTMTKNTERRQNDWISGECDVLLDDAIRDTKCVWDVSTMPWTDDEAMKKVIKSGYDWQGQAYMWLWDKPVHYVDFVLLPTPAHLLKSDDDIHQHIELVRKIPLKLRIRSVKIERDESVYPKIKERVEAAQDYYRELMTQFENNEVAA